MADAWRGRGRLGGAGRVLAIILVGQFAAACVVPRSMHVATGTTPEKSDINVRFRTTYYFRVFDYCTSAEIDSNNPYANIVPETDTLYRYRMTGKASALGNQIKFESGTLQKEQIDPFGADVVYNNDIDGYLYRSAEEAKQQAALKAERRDEAAARDRALADLNTLTEMLRKEKDADARTALIAAVKAALEQYLGTFRRPVDSATQKMIDDLKDKVTVVGAQLAALQSPGEADGVKALRADMQREVEALKGSITALKAKTAQTLDDFCAIDQIQRRGFQIMGPEGMRPFDQDARLIMAMHSSAKPLIETLSEYSGRLLQPQVNPAEQLLPLARETTRIVQTQRAVDRVAIKVAEGGDVKATVAEVFDAATQAFTPEAR